MANKIKFRRGFKSALPTLEVGEPAFTTDTKELYVGSDTGNVNITGKQGLQGVKGDKGDRGPAGAGNGIGFTQFTFVKPYETSSLSATESLYILPSRSDSCDVTFGGITHSVYSAVLIVLVSDDEGNKHLLVMNDNGETSTIEQDEYSDYIKVEGAGLVIG